MLPFDRSENTPGEARLWALEKAVHAECAANPEFEFTLLRDPLGVMRERFGDAMMPNEGEVQIPLPGGGFRVVFPGNLANWFLRRLEEDELPDELLEAVSGGTNPGGPQKHEYE